METPDDNVAKLPERQKGVFEQLDAILEKREIPLPPVEAELAAASVDSLDGDRARAEEAALVAGFTRKQMADRAYRAEHDRSERFRNHFERLAIVALWSMAIAILLIAAVWLLHMILPAERRWLTTEDLSHIQSIVTAGLLVGVIGNHFKKRLT